MIDREDIGRMMSEADAKKFVKETPPGKTKKGKPQWMLRDVLAWMRRNGHRT